MNVATAGIEELIWIVVGIFWVIAQIAGGAAKKKKASPFRGNPQDEPRPATDKVGEPAENPPVLSEVEGFANLMQKLAGVQEIKAPKPQWIEEPSPVDAVSPPRSIPVQNAVGTPRLQKKTPASVAPPITNVAEVDIRPTMSSFRSVMPAMKLPSMKMSFQTSEKSTAISPMLGNIINPADKRTLRRAMLSHIIFSPPKALEGMK